MNELQEVEILLVEDDAGDAEMTLRALKRANIGNRVVWLRDGAAALDYLFGNGDMGPSARPRVVLLDLKMPKVDGIEVLRRIKSDPVLRSLPVVMLTSSAQEGDIIRSYDLGVNSYLVKPVDFTQFSEEIQRAGLYWVIMNRAPG